MRVKQVFRKGLQGSLIVLLAAGSLHVGAADNYYRWLDNRGNPVHSDRPPPAGVDYEVVSTRSGLKRVVTGDEGAVPREVVPTISNDFQPVARSPDVRNFKNPEICEIARTNLNVLNDSARVQIRNDQGEVVFLTDEDRVVRKEEAAAMMQQHCE